MAKSRTAVKKCLQCGKPLKGRADKQFCDIGCKNDYHNADLAEGEKIYKRVLKILRNNRKVLKETLGDKTSIDIALEKLIAKGFDNDYLTHSKQRSGNKVYYFSFDYGYREEGSGIVKIVKAFDWAS